MVKRESPVYSVRLVLVYIFPCCSKGSNVLLSFPPSILLLDTKGSKAGKWTSPAFRLTILGLLKSITSSGEAAPA